MPDHVQNNTKPMMKDRFDEFKKGFKPEVQEKEKVYVRKEVPKEIIKKAFDELKPTLDMYNGTTSLSNKRIYYVIKKGDGKGKYEFFVNGKQIFKNNIQDPNWNRFDRQLVRNIEKYLNPNSLFNKEKRGYDTKESLEKERDLDYNNNFIKSLNNKYAKALKGFYLYNFDNFFGEKFSGRFLFKKRKSLLLI